MGATVARVAHQGGRGRVRARDGRRKEVESLWKRWIVATYTISWRGTESEDSVWIRPSIFHIYDDVPVGITCIQWTRTEVFPGALITSLAPFSLSLSLSLVS